MESKLEYKHNFPSIFYSKTFTKIIHSFLDENSKETLKQCLKKTGAKETKKRLKNLIKNYIIDLGTHNEKVKYFINKEGKLIITTNIFNINKEYLKQFSYIVYKQESLNMDKAELFSYLQVQPKLDIILSNFQENTKETNTFLKISKPILAYDFYIKEKKSDIFSEEEEDKYKMFYDNSNIEQLKQTDFSNKDSLIERQKKLLSDINSKKIPELFYPLKFISNVNFWCIILCEGGFFSYCYYQKDKELEHKSDHKYVIRKKAGQRQVVKDKSKNIKSIGAQIRRENEKKHQENIEMILKINAEQIERSDIIFIHAPGFNKGIFIGDNRPLEKYKGKIFNLPYKFDKANYSNVINAYKRLTNVYLEIKDNKVKELFK